VKVSQAVGDDLVGDVTLEVDDEAVVPETPLGWPRLQLRQVDVTGRELPDDRVKAARMIEPLEADDARVVVARRARYSRTRHRYEASLVLRVVLDLLGENDESIDGLPPTGER
jgi:hypothetical protein